MSGHRERDSGGGRAVGCCCDKVADVVEHQHGAVSAAAEYAETGQVVVAEPADLRRPVAQDSFGGGDQFADRRSCACADVQREIAIWT
jgi:hypothetical protein